MQRAEFIEFLQSSPSADWEGHANENFEWWLQSNTEEIWLVLEELNIINAQIILEIGTNHGGSAIIWDRQVGPTGQVITLDYPKLPHARGIIDCSDYKPVSNFTALLSDSHEFETIMKIKKLLKDSVDFLFIDGDHSYNGLKMDYEMYNPLVRKGGIVAIDDCVIMPDTVGKFWNEIESNKKLIPLPRDGHGMGIVYM